MRRPVVLAALAIALSSAPAAAQPRPQVAGPHVSVRDSSALRAQLGIPVAQRLLTSDDFATRIRGIERFGAIGTTEAIDALVDAMDQSSVAVRDPRARLTAVRVLAEEVKRDNVRQVLLREVTDTSGSDGRGGVSSIAGVLRATAALALARSGDKKALGGLAGLLLQPGPTGEAALHALRVYPPASLDSFLEGHKRLTPALATFLGELGDLRALDRLRAMIQEGDPAGKAAAAIALAKLGDEAALPVAREWLKKGEPRQRRAAAEVLVYLDAPEAAEAVTALLANDASRDDGLRLALLAPAPALAAPLAKALPDLAPELRGRAIAAIGRAGGAGGVAALAPLLDRSDTALPAAFALATMPGDDARAAIEKAIGSARSGDARRLLLRAGTVRALVLDDAPSGLKDGLRALFKETSPADRAAGAFGLVALGMMSLGDALDASCKGGKGDAGLACDVTAVAAARGALALPDGASSLEPLMPLLKRAAALSDPRALSAPTPDASGPLREALTVAVGAALLAHPDGGELSTSVLAAWAEAGGPLAPLAARALPSRDDEAIHGRIKRLLEGSDPVVRAHVALGLGRDPEASAVSLLTSAYRFEEDAGVRRAVVRALSRRTEVQRTATLVLARDLDPDEEVRWLARAALEGRDLDLSIRPALGVEPRRSVAWVAIQSNEGPAPGGDAPLRTARLQRADGLVVPAVADPDGVLLVPGLPAGPASLLLGRAPEPARPRPVTPSAPVASPAAAPSEAADP
jgi:cellulose synthase operon protein C